MGLTIPRSVAREFRILDHDFAIAPVAAENAVLVVMKIAVAHGEPTPLEANASAISIDDFGARKLDVLDLYVVTLDDPDAFLFGTATGSCQPCAAADGSQYQVIFIQTATSPL